MYMPIATVFESYINIDDKRFTTKRALIEGPQHVDAHVFTRRRRDSPMEFGMSGVQKWVGTTERGGARVQTIWPADSMTWQCIFHRTEEAALSIIFLRRRI